MLTESIHNLQSMRGTLEKAEFIKANAADDAFRSFLYYALNPLLTYKVSEQTLRQTRTTGTATPGTADIFSLCEELAGRKAVDDQVLNRVCGFLCAVQDVDERELYIKLLAKTIRLGVTAKTVNKLIPGLIPEWEVQQAYPIDKHPIKPGTWFALTEKLNGVRATYYHGELIARSGSPYIGLEHITQILDALSAQSNTPLVFDGELTLKDKGVLTDNEAFRIATGIINSENRDKTAICYTMFDVLPTDEFDSGESKDGYIARRTFLGSFLPELPTGGPVRILPLEYDGRDQSMIELLLGRMIAEDKEGLMANLDVPYKRKRHSGILKIKRFYTMDLPILACEEGSGRLAGVLGAFVLGYKGNEVRVGSGFTDEQRVTYWKHRDELPGTLCEVKYKEVSYDKHTGA
ncbi:MAG: hypothetical protein NC548_54825, partial [Lachnospiraceae bacterium]|nr:hypothetical protein [Lachnospiraceae bacterium]